MNYDKIIIRELKKFKSQEAQQTKLKRKLVDGAMTERTFYDHLTKLACTDKPCGHDPRHLLLHEWRGKSSFYILRECDNFDAVEVFRS